MFLGDNMSFVGILVDVSQALMINKGVLPPQKMKFILCLKKIEGLLVYTSQVSKINKGYRIF